LAEYSKRRATGGGGGALLVVGLGGAVVVVVVTVLFERMEGFVVEATTALVALLVADCDPKELGGGPVDKEPRDEGGPFAVAFAVAIALANGGLVVEALALATVGKRSL
jgi:hypothetical protein